MFVVNVPGHCIVFYHTDVIFFCQFHRRSLMFSNEGLAKDHTVSYPVLPNQNYPNYERSMGSTDISGSAKCSAPACGMSIFHVGKSCYCCL